MNTIRSVSDENIRPEGERRELSPEGYFGRAENKQKTRELAYYFGGEKTADQYRENLVKYAYDTWSRKLYIALTDPLIQARAFTLMKKLHQVDHLIEQQAESERLLFLQQQKQDICSLFEELKYLVPYNEAIKKFARTTPAVLRSEGYIQFRYGKDRRSPFDTAGFREKVRGELTNLTSVSFDLAPDTLYKTYILEQIDTVLGEKGRIEEILHKEPYQKELLCIVAFNNQQRQAIYISAIKKLITHLTELDKQTGSPIDYTIDSIDKNIFTQKFGPVESFYGLATVYGKPDKVLFEKNAIVSRIGPYEIDSCTFHQRGNMLLAETTDPYGKQTKQCFSRTTHFQRVHVCKYRNPNENKVHYLESIETIDDEERYIYGYVQEGIKNPSKKEVKKIPLEWFDLL